MAIARLDHVVIAVHDLAAAIADYTTLGFTVIRGGQHPGMGSHNALVAFADGVYLEIVARLPGSAAAAAPGRPSPAVRRVMLWWAVGEGLADFAVLPSAIAADVARVQAAGVALFGPVNGGRLRPDGQHVKWQTAFPEQFDLPFLCGDITPRSLRLPPAEAAHHANGVTGLLGLTVGVNSLEHSIERWTALLGHEPKEESTVPSVAADTADFVIGPWTITLAAPAAPESLLSDFLAERREGVYSLTLATSNRERTGILDPGLAHEARIELVAG